jgi:hypothetical protein
MPEVRLDCPRVVAIVGELVAAGMAEHMGVRLDAQIGRDGCPLDHVGEARCRQRRTAFRVIVRIPAGADPTRASRVRSKGALHDDPLGPKRPPVNISAFGSTGEVGCIQPWLDLKKQANSGRRQIRSQGGILSHWQEGTMGRSATHNALSLRETRGSRHSSA